MFRHLAASLKSGWTWWWGFGLLIAAPALLLALLGLRAVRAERIEREQQLREQQTQIARLADAALIGVWSELEQALLRSAEPAALQSPDFVFTFTAPDELVFQTDKVGYGEAMSLPERAVNWSFATQQLIEQAQAAEAQGRVSAAAELYRRLSQSEPKLRGWAEFCLARRGTKQDVLTLLPRLLEDRTPTGLPVALLLCAFVEPLPADQRVPFAGLLRATLERLRQGHWWLSYDERQFYDAELCRLLPSVAAHQSLAPDARLEQLAALARNIRRSPPVNRNGATRSYERDGAAGFLLFYAPVPQSSEVWRGRALVPARITEVLNSTLAPLFFGQPFAGALRTAQGDVVWSNLPNNTTLAPGEPLRSISGWEIVFSQPARNGWGTQRVWLWYGFILLLVVMLLVGLAMTARVVRHEMELSRLQNEFIAAISHEFKSPLTSIRLLMERLTSGRLHEAAAAHEYHNAINRETARLERLVNRLLESQQIQAGQKQYHFTDADLSEIAATAAAQLQPQAEAKGIRLETVIQPALPLLPLDQVALLDALENLLDNAIKYSPAGTRVKLTAQATAQGVCIDVRDEGIGIEPNDLPRIFDRFYRGQPGNQHSVKGTGLGLALVKAAVEAHGGSVAVESQPGQGSRFTLQLPGKEGSHNGAHSGS